MGGSGNSCAETLRQVGPGEPCGSRGPGRWGAQGVMAGVEEVGRTALVAAEVTARVTVGAAMTVPAGVGVAVVVVTEMAAVAATVPVVTAVLMVLLQTKY